MTRTPECQDLPGVTIELRRDLMEQSKQGHLSQGAEVFPTRAQVDATDAATGIAESDLDLMSLPIPAFDDLMARSHEFRGLIFQAYAERITDLMLMAEERQASSRHDSRWQPDQARHARSAFYPRLPRKPTRT